MNEPYENYCKQSEELEDADDKYQHPELEDLRGQQQLQPEEQIANLFEHYKSAPQQSCASFTPQQNNENEKSTLSLYPEEPNYFEESIAVGNLPIEPDDEHVEA